jgi:hypothetical protein
MKVSVSQSECAFENRFEKTGYRLKAMNTEFFIVIALDIGDISIERYIVHRILAKPSLMHIQTAAVLVAPRSVKTRA